MAGKGKERGGKPRPRREKDDKGWQKKQKRKICIFCKDHIDYVDYKDVMTLRKFVSERGKIRARRVSGNCVQHQRDVATAVQKPVDDLGSPGDVLDVADGYARNYLVPRGLAIKAHKGAVKQADTLHRAHSSRMSKQKAEFEAVASRLIAGGPIHVSARAGEEGKLFGSVTAADLAEAIASQVGVTVDRKDVHLEDPIKSVGTHEVRVHLFAEVDPVVTVEVVAEG
jgi:large subunit ribosomal protein L9